MSEDLTEPGMERDASSISIERWSRFNVLDEYAWCWSGITIRVMRFSTGEDRTIYFLAEEAGMRICDIADSLSKSISGLVDRARDRLRFVAPFMEGSSLKSFADSHGGADALLEKIERMADDIVAGRLVPTELALSMPELEEGAEPKVMTLIEGISIILGLRNAEDGHQEIVIRVDGGWSPDRAWLRVDDEVLKASKLNGEFVITLPAGIEPDDVALGFLVVVLAERPADMAVYEWTWPSVGGVPFLEALDRASYQGKVIDIGSKMTITICEIDSFLPLLPMDMARAAASPVEQEPDEGEISQEIYAESSILGEDATVGEDLDGFLYIYFTNPERYDWSEAQIYLVEIEDQPVIKARLERDTKRSDVSMWRCTSLVPRPEKRPYLLVATNVKPAL